jgi:hypothetical protein
MVKNSNEINGKGMAVLIGAVLILIALFTKLGFWTDLIIISFGALLIWLGIKN